MAINSQRVESITRSKLVIYNNISITFKVYLSIHHLKLLVFMTMLKLPTHKIKLVCYCRLCFQFNLEPLQVLEKADSKLLKS